MIWIVVILTETPRKKTYIFETHLIAFGGIIINIINNSTSSVGFPEREHCFPGIPFIDNDSITCHYQGPGQFNF